MMATPRQVPGKGMLFSFLILLITGSALPAGAQLDDPRWQPWLGCWEAVGEPDDAPVLCLAPVSGEDGIEMITLIDERVVSREMILANAQDHRVTEEGCDGWERAEFSDDAHRVFFNSQFVCDGDVHRTSSGVMSMLRFPSEWLDVRAVEVDGQSVPWVLRYRIASQADFEAAGLTDMADKRLAVESARIAASSALTLGHVIEASSKVDPEVVKAWIAETGEPFALDASQLSRMADGGVPDGVIDVMIAVSYPENFVLNTGDGADLPLRASYETRDGIRRRFGSSGYVDSFYDPFYDPYVRYGRYSAFGYSRYGLGYGGYGRYGGYGLDYGRYGRYGGYGVSYGGYGGYGYGLGGYSVYRPRAVVVGRRPTEAAGGRAVMGRGYTRSGGVAASRGASTRSSGSSAAGAASSGGARRAKPRSGPPPPC